MILVWRKQGDRIAASAPRCQQRPGADAPAYRNLAQPRKAWLPLQVLIERPDRLGRIGITGFRTRSNRYGRLFRYKMGDRYVR